MAPFTRGKKLMRQRSASPSVNTGDRMPASGAKRMVTRPRKFKRQVVTKVARQRSASPRLSNVGYKQDSAYKTPGGQSLDDFVQVISTVPYSTPKFKHHRTETKMVLTNLDRCDDPENMLCSAFARCLTQARERVKEKVYKIGAVIQSKNLDAPIEVPFREAWQCSPAMLLHEFQRVAQPKRAGSLYGAPLTVSVTVLGSHEGGHRTKAVVRHNINQGHLLKIVNNNTYCFFYALEAARLYKTKGREGEITTLQFSRMMRPSSQLKGTGVHALETYAKRLMGLCGIPLGLPSYSFQRYIGTVQGYYNNAHPGKYRSSVFSTVGSYKPLYVANVDAFEHDICVLYDPQAEHYDGVRTINQLFGKGYYCIDCRRPYRCQQGHTSKCVRKCSKCGSVGPDRPCQPDGQQKIRCDGCCKTFDNRDCYNRHYGVQCGQYKMCLDCGICNDMRNIRRFSESGRHECDISLCTDCRVYHRKGTGCFISPLATPEMKDARLCFFDTESTQNERIEDEMRDRSRHRCNALHASIVCTRCIRFGWWKEDNTHGCPICGPKREYWWFNGDGADPLKEFVELLLYRTNKDFPTYVLGHYAGRYDYQHVNTELYRIGNLCPEVIRQGHRIFYMRIKKKGMITDTIFKDSWALFPSKLDEFVDAFGLHDEVDHKPFFPYLFNCQDNYDVRLKHLPPMDTYCPDHMNSKRRRKFEEWHMKNYWTPFYLPNDLKKYTFNDVKLLKYGMIKFRQAWLEICGEDIIQNAITISAACMRFYRMRFLQKDTIAITPHRGYERNDRQSCAALKFLKWFAHETGIDVRTAESDGGEFRHYYADEQGHRKHFKLDGYIEARDGGRPIALEFKGCYIHGHLTHMLPETLCANGKTVALNVEADELRERILHQDGFDVVVYWECEVAEELQRNKRMKAFYDEILDEGIIEPRDAFCGGRTGPSGLLAEDEEPHREDTFVTHAIADDGTEINYFDIVSLYPFINFVGSYPTARPNVVVIKQDVDWRQPSDNPYRGLLKVLVVAPQSLLIPVIPMRMDNRLLFMSCYRCAKEYADKSTVVPDYCCEHEEKDRQFVVTVTHNELNKALEKGYRVKRLIRVWEFSQWSSELFKGYVRQWLALKVKSSELPEDVLTDEDKARFAKAYFDRYGVVIKPEVFDENETLRQIAKNCLNSKVLFTGGLCLVPFLRFWGRFAIRSNLSQDKVTDSPADYWELITDPRLDVRAVDMVSKQIAHVVYNVRDEFVTENHTSNIFIAIWTTSLARLHLYSYMEKIAESPGCRLLYTDTDSVIFTNPRGKCPIPSGEFLGEMKNEYPKHRILEFVCGGAKQYALKLAENTNPRKIGYCTKLRGFTLDDAASHVINFYSMKKQVLNYANAKPLYVKVNRFQLSRQGHIDTVRSYKKYVPYNQKSIILADGTIVPFGYNPSRP